MYSVVHSFIKIMKFNKETAAQITEQIRAILTGHEYLFEVVNQIFPCLSDSRTDSLSPSSATSGDALNLNIDGFVTLTVVDTYGVWQICDGDEVNISGNKIIVSKSIAN
jgi:hypothetical protein